MRLTLRTLLAWMDRVLPPEPLEALGAKVAASPVATDLLERVEAAVSRDTLPAPPPDARRPADDANSVAEYLDNVLPADRLEPFERACLESDARLAEAAACHRMLAELVADPGCVPTVEAGHARRLRDIVRERLPALADAARTSPAGRPRGSKAPETAPLPEASRPLPATVDRRRAPTAAWIAAGTAVALLATLGAVLGWSLLKPQHRGQRMAAGGDVEPGRPAAPAAAAGGEVQVIDRREVPESDARDLPAGGDQPAGIAPRSSGHEPAAAEAAAASSPGTPGAPHSAGPSSPVVEPGPGRHLVPTVPASPPREDRRVPDGDALAIVAPPTEPAAPTGGQGAMDPPPGDARPATEPAAGGKAAGATGLVVTGVALHRPLDAADWTAVVADEPVEEPVELLVPPWCSAVAEIPAASIRLEPATRAVISQEADGSPRIEVIFGRAVIRPAAADVRVGVSAGGLVGAVSGATGQPVGIDVELPRAPGSDPATAGDRRRAAVIAGPAALTWIQTGPDGTPPAPLLLAGLPPELPLDAGASIRWDSGDAAAATVTLPTAEPDWLGRPPTAGRIEAAAVAALAARLRSEDSAAAALAAMLEDGRAENRMVAAAALALIGDYDPLVGLLVADPRAGGLREAQWDALQARTVPLALARGTKSAAAFLEALSRRGPAGGRELLAELVGGVSDEALAAGGTERLVAALDDPAVVVRRYAIRILRGLLGAEAREPVAYRADRDPALQREAVAWWRRMVDTGRLRRVPPGAGP